MTIDEQIGIRLNQFITTTKLSQTALSQLIGVRQSFLSQILVGKKGMSAKVIINITKAVKNLNIRWLLTGDGEMFEFSNYYPPAELESGKLDKLEEGIRIEYAKPKYQLEAMHKRLEDHERRLRDLEKKQI